MVRIKYDFKLMKFISLFETLTRSNVKDCIEGDTLIFVVQQGQLGKALGKNASNIKRLEKVFKRKIKIIGFHEDISMFVKNMIAPFKVENIMQEDRTVIISDPSSQVKGKIIGRSASNLKRYIEITKRYFDIDEIVVK